MPDAQGYLSLVLHAHLPYVRHPEHEDFLEERWFFEALTETYLPLLRMLDGLENDGVEYRLQLSLSPTLVTMFEDELLQERYVAHLAKLQALIERELETTRHDEALHHLAEWYRDFFAQTRYWFEERCGRRVAMAYARLAAGGRLELMTCAATHGFLPLLREDIGAVTAQVGTAVAHHKSVFGVPPAGMWIPECAYFPGLEEVLDAAGIRYFCVESRALEHASERPPMGVYAPVYTPAGVAAFARDPESSHQVWSGDEGYPGHPTYREFYRDIGFEREESYLADVLIDGRIRGDTGIKYYRVTGSEEKELYDPDAARDQAARHAEDFIARRTAQAERLAAEHTRPPLVTAPYDAELFGHWWFEGPVFLDMLFRKLHSDQEAIQPVTFSEYLQKHPTNAVTTPAGSSWGGEGHYAFWLDESNAWVYPLLNHAAERYAGLVGRHGDAEAGSLVGRALRQAGRELLIAQGSDWTFIMRTGTSPEYAGTRVRDHLARCDRLCTMLEHDSYDETVLAALEYVDMIFPGINPQLFRSSSNL